MHSSRLLTRILLSASSFLITSSALGFNCPSLTKHQLSTVCRSKEFQRLGMHANVIEVEGIRFINNENCDTWRSIVTAIKSGNDPIKGEFQKKDSFIEPGHLKSQGECVYLVPRLIKGEKEVRLAVASEQKLLEGVRVSPVASNVPPTLGGEKVVNPEAPKQLPTIGESIQKGASKALAKIGIGKPTEHETEPVQPAQYHEAELKEKLAARKEAEELPQPASPAHPEVDRKKRQAMYIAPGQVPGVGPEHGKVEPHQVIEDYKRQSSDESSSSSTSHSLAELRNNPPSEPPPVPPRARPVPPPRNAPGAVMVDQGGHGSTPPNRKPPEPPQRRAPVPPPRENKPLATEQPTGAPQSVENELAAVLAKRKNRSEAE